jgi:hypothetical protein
MRKERGRNVSDVGREARRARDRSFGCVVAWCAAWLVGSLGAQANGGSGEQGGKPGLCAYSVEKPHGGDFLPARVDSGDDFAHAHALGPVAQGESYATAASLATFDSDAKTWALIHHPVPTCLPVTFRSWASLQHVLRAGAGPGTGSRHGAVVKTQFLAGSVVGPLRTAGSAAASAATPTTTLVETPGGGKAEGRRTRVLERDDWYGHSSLSIAASSAGTAFGAAYVVVSECITGSASECSVHAVKANDEMVAIWFADYPPF